MIFGKLAAVLLVPMLVMIGCGRRADLPNIILISVDTLRADHVGAYGYEKKVTPSMDRLALEGVRFSDCRASAPWTLPSHATMFTGLYPTDHHAVDDKVKIREDAPMLAQRMKSAGYKTAAFVAHYYVGSQYGFQRGFDDFHEGEEVAADQIADLATRWLKKNRDKSFFLFLHFFDPHTPYTPPPSIRVKRLPPEDDWIRGDTADVLHVVNNENDPKTKTLLDGLMDLYDGEIEFTDQMIGRVLETMERLQMKNTG